jgi:hypothetical protein
MTKAKLIKKQQLPQSPHRPAASNASKPTAKRPAEVVRDWIGQRQQAQPSARQAFAALFSNPEQVT